MWFSSKKGAARDLRDAIYNPCTTSSSTEPSPDLPKKSLITSKQFLDEIVPELMRRWEVHCFCKNPHFLKLVSFNFEDYDIAPAFLADTQLVIHHVALRYLTPTSEWTSSPGTTDQKRTFCCPQCRTNFEVRSADYSINMDRTVMTPAIPLKKADVGQYVIGYVFFVGQEKGLDRITDFKLAESIEKFLEELTQPH